LIVVNAKSLKARKVQGDRDLRMLLIMLICRMLLWKIHTKTYQGMFMKYFLGMFV